MASMTFGGCDFSTNDVSGVVIANANSVGKITLVQGSGANISNLKWTISTDVQQFSGGTITYAPITYGTGVTTATTDITYGGLHYITSEATSATIDITAIYENEFFRNSGWTHYRQSPQDMMRGIIRDRSFPTIITRHQHLRQAQDIREARARETLRQIVGEAGYRQLITKGFVSFRSKKSGLVYQIRPGHGFTTVIKNGQPVENLCVVLNGDFPDTDSVIVRFLMLANNEAEFRRLANVHRIMDINATNVTPYNKGYNKLTLPEAYKKLKKVA